ncbi:Lrp/AsnC family transcriptional regulator [Pseudoroseomonas cervicalis]|nr:Lrp/AsnC family transcriptional regulator [Pseudoroseomonas cervicalis]
MQPPVLDHLDRKLLRLLRADGRMSNAALAAAIGLSPSACLRRLRLLEAGGVIRGYTAIIEDPGPQGRTTVIVQITLEKQTEDAFNRFEAAVRQCPEVCECYLMTGNADYQLRVEARDAADYERIHKEQLSRMPGVARIQSAFAIRTVVRGADPARLPEPA